MSGARSIFHTDTPAAATPGTVLNRQQSYLAATLNNIGTLMYKQRKFSDALSFYLESIRVGLWTGRSDNRDDQASMASRVEEMDRLLTSLKQSWYEVSPAGPTIPDESCEIGMGSFSMESIQLELKAIDQNTTTGERCWSSDQSFKTIYNMGLVHSTMENTRQAKLLYEQALSHIESRDDYLQVGVLCLHHIGRINYFEKQYIKALNSFSKALEGGWLQVANYLPETDSACTVSQYRRFVATTLVGISLTFVQLEELNGAIGSCQEALYLQTTALRDDLMGSANALHVMGQIHQLQGRTQEAINHYQSSLLRVVTKVGEMNLRVASTLQTIGELLLLLDNGRPGDALRYFLKALGIKIHVLGDSHVDVSRTLFSIGCVFHEQENYVDALSLYRQTLEIQEDSGEDDLELEAVLCHMARVLHLTGELDEALQTYHRALCLGSNEDMSFIVRQCGYILLEQNELSSAMIHFVTAQRTCGELHDENHNDSARIACVLSVHQPRLPASPVA